MILYPMLDNEIRATKAREEGGGIILIPIRYVQSETLDMKTMHSASRGEAA